MSHSLKNGPNVPDRCIMHVGVICEWGCVKSPSDNVGLNVKRGTFAMDQDPKSVKMAWSGGT